MTNNIVDRQTKTNCNLLSSISFPFIKQYNFLWLAYFTDTHLVQKLAYIHTHKCQGNKWPFIFYVHARYRAAISDSSKGQDNSTSDIWIKILNSVKITYNIIKKVTNPNNWLK